MADVQTYTLEEFTTGEWTERPEYSSESISIERIMSQHEIEDTFAEYGKCGETGFLYFLHMRGETSFEFYLYQVTSWDMEDAPRSAEPFMWVYGTTFDGVCESSGGQNFSASLPDMAAALTWLHQHCLARWGGYAGCYES